MSGPPSVNQLSLTAQVLEIQPLRHTPSGQAVLEMLLEHESQAVEAGIARQIQLTLRAVAMGDIALLLAGTALGTPLSITGFLAPRRKGSERLVLHIQQAGRLAPGDWVA
jgi:primosomal replication protein N